MSQYVSGKTEPRRDILKVLAQALEVDYLWLEGDNVAMTADSHPAKEQQGKNSWSIGEDGMRTFNKSSKLDRMIHFLEKKQDQNRSQQIIYKCYLLDCKQPFPGFYLFK